MPSRPEDAPADYEKARTNVRAFVERGFERVNEKELDARIANLEPIPMTTPKMIEENLFGLLVDLRIALYRPDQQGLLKEGATRESLWQNLKEAVA